MICSFARMALNKKEVAIIARMTASRLELNLIFIYRSILGK